jgi:hypothetical protein
MSRAYLYSPSGHFVACYRVTFTLKRDEVTGEWRKLPNEELTDLYFSPILRVIKSRRMRCSTYGEGERCVQGFGGEPEGK